MAIAFDLPENTGTVARYPDGGVIFIRGDRGECAYIVRSGEVEIREAGRAIERDRPGDIFGEMALIDDGPRSASAVAIGATTVSVIDRDTFHRLVREHPDFAIAVMRELARRLRSMNAQQRPARNLPIAPDARQLA